jgi:glutaredoxin 3
MAKITVYSTDPCSFCERAKQLLKVRELEFNEVNLAKDPAGRAQLVEETGMLSFPQIIVGDVLVGGFQQLVQADQSGRLAELTAQAA